MLASQEPGARIQTVTERWPSGLRRTPAKRVYPKRVPRVQIPLSPPLSPAARQIIKCKFHGLRIEICNLKFLAPVAQLDRAPDYGSGGWEFESLRARHNESVHRCLTAPERNGLFFCGSSVMLKLELANARVYELALLRV